MSISRRTSRRDLLRAVGLGGGVALLAPFALRGGAIASAADARSYGSGTVALEIDGSQSPLQAAEGGNAVADVALDAPTPDLIQHKHVVNVKFEDLILQLPLAGASKALSNWITTTLQKGPLAKSGALVYGDGTGREVKRLEFLNALISEVALPAGDASSNSAAYLTLRLTPEMTRLTGTTGKLLTQSSGSRAVRALSSLFRMNVQGLEAAAPRTLKVSAVSARRAAPAAGAFREPTKQSPALDCSMLSLTLAERDAGPFFQWFTDSAVKGNPDERAGRLEYLAPDLRVIATADFGNLGIVRYAPAAFPAGDTIPQVQVDMYCETMNLTLA